MPLLHEQIHVADPHTANDSFAPVRAPAVEPDAEYGLGVGGAAGQTGTLGTGVGADVESARDRTKHAQARHEYGYPPDKAGRDTSRDDVTLAPSATVSSTENGDKRGTDGAANMVKPMDAVVEEEGDGVWGKMGEGSPNYKNVGWIVSGIFLINLQIGLGALSMPRTLHTIGLVPGILVIFGVAVITTWADMIIGVFKKAHPSVYTLADVGQILFGKTGREVMGFAYWIFCMLIAAGNLLAFSTAMNAITLHATCTIVWVLIGAIVSIAAAMIRTLDKISWLGWVGFVSLMVSLITCTIAVGVQDRPAEAPQDEPWETGVRLFNNPGFLAGVGAASNIVLSFAGGPAFFNVISEMRDARDYPKSVYFCQVWVTATYLVIACVMYHYVGQYISSPALGSAGVLMKRVCYGLVLPGLVVGVVLYVHLPAKYVFVRALRNTKHLTQSTWQHWAVWTGCIIGTTIIAFIVALACPVFDSLVGLMGSLCGTPLAITIPAYMWIWETRRTQPASTRGLRWWLIAAFNMLLIAASAFQAVAGVVAAVVAINDEVSRGSSSPFSCADNSNST